MCGLYTVSLLSTCEEMMMTQLDERATNVRERESERTRLIEMLNL